MSARSESIEMTRTLRSFGGPDAGGGAASTTALAIAASEGDALAIAALDPAGTARSPDGGDGRQPATVPTIASAAIAGMEIFTNGTPRFLPEPPGEGKIARPRSPVRR